MQCVYFHFEIAKEQEKIKIFDLKMINWNKIAILEATT